MKKWVIAIIIMMCFSATSLYSQQCEIEYTWVEGNWPNQVEKTETETVAPGVNRSMNQMHITQIVNKGRNDAKITTRNNTTSADAVYHTINNGSQTIWFPLPNFTNTRLHRISCQNYATIHDANDIIAEFNGSAQNLINKAKDFAEVGANNAKNTITGMVNVVTYNNLQQQFEQGRQNMDQKWLELQQLAAESGEIGNLIMSQHFPELHEALEATANANNSIQSNLLEAHDQNSKNLLAKLREMDDKYMVSSNLNTFTSIKLENQFPEFFALNSASCSIDNGLFNQFGDDFNRLASLLRAALDELITEADLPLFSFTADEMDRLTGILASPPCLKELEENHKLILQDLNSFMEFVKSIEVNLNEWQASWFARGNEAVYEESRRLLDSTRSMIQMLGRQIELEFAAQEAKEEMDESFERLSGNYGRITVAGAPVPDFINIILNSNDSDRIEQDLENHRAAVETYERALNQRDRGWQNVGRSATGWSQDLSSLASSISRLRLRFDPLGNFVELSAKRISLNIPTETIRLAQSCVTSMKDSITTTITIFGNAFGRYFSDLNERLQRMIPDELYMALNMRFDLISDIQANFNAQNNLANKSGILIVSHSILADSYLDLGATLSQGPSDPGYLENVNSKVDALSGHAEKLKSDYNEFQNALADARPGMNATMSAMIELRTSLQSHSITLPPALAELLAYTVSLEETLQNLENMSKSINDCVAMQLDLTREFLNTFPQRSRAFAALITELTINMIPDEVKLRIGNLIELAENQVSIHSELAGALIVYNELRGQAFNSAVNAAVSAIIPVPQPNAEAALQDLVQAFNALYAQAEVLNTLIQNIYTTDEQAVQELTLLAGWAMNQKSEIVQDILELNHIVLDVSPIFANLDQVQSLGPLWSAAAVQTPIRLGNLVTNEIAEKLEALRPQIESGLQSLATQTIAAVSCASDAIQARNQVANQSVNTAVTQATADISSSASTVYNNLLGLTSPSNNLLSSVEIFLNTGKALIADVNQSTVKGKQTFENLVSSSYNQIETSIACVNTRSAAIQGLIDDLGDYYTEIEGSQQLPQVQFQMIQLSGQN
jgi:hypothetical protein